MSSLQCGLCGRNEAPGPGRPCASCDRKRIHAVTRVVLAKPLAKAAADLALARAELAPLATSTDAAPVEAVLPPSHLCVGCGFVRRVAAHSTDAERSLCIACRRELLTYVSRDTDYLRAWVARKSAQ